MNTTAGNIARPTPSQARKLIIASLALVVCRIVSQWDSMAAGSAALAVLAVLAASIVADMPRVRRIVLFLALPAATLANAVVFALGGTHVTADGVEQLKVALPACTVHWDRTVDEP